MQIHFIVIGEGRSDEGLIPHLASLCIDAGADEATGAAPEFNRLPTLVDRTVLGKLRATLVLEPDANLFFIHRDADSRNSERRYSEISQAVLAANLTKSWIAVVPIQETEAWLLLSEAGIRKVAGNPNGRRPLRLPRPRQVETVARPKERLQRALTAASELTGRRLDRFRIEFPMHRSVLLARLPIGGPLEEVPAWTRMRDDLRRALGTL